MTYGPKTAAADRLDAMKYREPGENFREACGRNAFALTDDGTHYEEFREIILDLRFLPAGRIRRAAGASVRVTPYNCLSGDSEILTVNGFFPLSKIAGTSVRTLSPVSGKFETAKIKNYGRQELNRIVVSNSKNGQERAGTFEVFATLNHRWVLQNGDVTESLAVGDVLKAGHADFESDQIGWVHGFIYGDGSKVRDAVEGAPRSNPAYAEDWPFKKFQVRLCGAKARHLNRFTETSQLRARVTRPQSAEGDPFVICFNDRDFKEIPEDACGASYIRGFVEGLLAADGCFSVRRTDAFQFHGGREIVEWIRDRLVLAGYAPSGRAHECATEATEYGERSEPLWNQAFRASEDHKGFRVVGIEPWGEEDVFCAEEPKHKQIVLRNGLRTGNCFVSGTISDTYVGGGVGDSSSIMGRATEAAATMRMGGGIGYDFSTIRPRDSAILGIGGHSSGPTSFMRIFNEICLATSSAGNRRGAQMGVLRIDHPDVEEFVRAKQNQTELTGFNVSLGVTDEFMEAYAARKPFALRFGGTTYREVDAEDLWEKIMRSNYDWAEPGVLFIDRMNEMNNLWYCETLAATNPCFTGDTLVWTSEGHKRFDDLAKAGTSVLVLTQLKNGKLVYRKMTRPRRTARDKELVEVTFKGSQKRNKTITTVRCTPEHVFFLVGGKKKMAKDLLPKDRIASAYRAVANQKGYIKLRGERHEVFEHHVAAESKYGRWASYPRDHVHHKNDNKADNTPNNVEILLAKKHNSDNMRKKNAVPGLIPHDERNANYGDANGMFGKKHRRATLKKIGNKTSERFGDPAFRAKHSNAVREAMVKMTPEARAMNHTVVKVTRLTEREDVYCGTVAETGKFFVACGPNEGVLVSNCAEQPLPPYGACLLGSFNLPAYLVKQVDGWSFDADRLRADVLPVVRAMDNVVDRALYPLAEQEAEAKAKRRMGLGVTGLANAAEALGFPYASNEFLAFEDKVLELIAVETYRASATVAAKKGAFPLFDVDKYLDGKFVRMLPDDVKTMIRKNGIRNSHLTSIAPTGTISMLADNVSSGVEPVFAHSVSRPINTPDGPAIERLDDYGVKFLGVRGRLASDVAPKEHVDVLVAAQRRVDSAVSKTCNLANGIEWDAFKDVYLRAYEGQAKGCTVYRAGCKREGLMTEDAPLVAEGPACEVVNGVRSCE
jgi:ribonucleotide reductase alpha subunit